MERLTLEALDRAVAWRVDLVADRTAAACASKEVLAAAAGGFRGRALALHGTQG